jgi:putative transcription factor
MCGKECGTIKAVIEGSQLNVCPDCAKFGKIVPQDRRPAFNNNYNTTHNSPVHKSQVNAPASPVTYLAVIDDFADKIRQKRDSLCITQDDLAKMMSERASLFQKIESGHFKPSIELARKLENFLKIKLVETREEEAVAASKKDPNILTIGDLIQMKMAQSKK